MELKNVEIIRINELKTFQNSDFKCVEWHVKTEEQYPQTLNLQSNNDKAENLIKYNKVGDKVDVSINLRGREWVNPQGETKVFNTIEAWKVFKSDSAKETPQPPTNFEPVGNLKEEEQDDLPF
jgi:hypothetical protein